MTTGDIYQSIDGLRMFFLFAKFIEFFMDKIAIVKYVH